MSALARTARKSTKNRSELASRPSRVTDRLRKSLSSSAEASKWCPEGCLGSLWTLLSGSWGALGRALSGAPGSPLGDWSIFDPPWVDVVRLGKHFRSSEDRSGCEFDWRRTTTSQRQPQRLAHRSSLLRTAGFVSLASIGQCLESSVLYKTCAISKAWVL